MAAEHPLSRNHRGNNKRNNGTRKNNAASATPSTNEWTWRNTLNAMPDESLVELLNTFIVNKGPSTNLMTATRKGNAVYRRKTNLTPAQKRAAITMFRENIFHASEFHEAPSSIYTWIVKGGDLINDTDEELHRKLYAGEIQFYAARTCVGQEIGSLHRNLDQLTSLLDGDTRPITAAGELYLDPRGRLFFNLRSGTYMMRNQYRMLAQYVRAHPQMDQRTAVLMDQLHASVNLGREADAYASAMLHTFFNWLGGRCRFLFEEMNLAALVRFRASDTAIGGEPYLGSFQITKSSSELCQFYDEYVRPYRPEYIGNNTTRRTLMTHMNAAEKSNRIHRQYAQRMRNQHQTRRQLRATAAAADATTRSQAATANAAVNNGSLANAFNRAMNMNGKKNASHR